VRYFCLGGLRCFLNEKLWIVQPNEMRGEVTEERLHGVMSGRFIVNQCGRHKCVPP
jgi:hypothetical protein